MKRRSFLGAAAFASGVGLGDVPAHRWDSYDFGSGPKADDRLNQGPFDIDQDEGWRTLVATTATHAPLRNPGMGPVGYIWEEGGPSLATRAGQPVGGGVRQASFLLPKGFAGPVKLRAEVEIRPGVWRPVRWDGAQPLEADGSLKAVVVGPDEPGWRKGV